MIDLKEKRKLAAEIGREHFKRLLGDKLRPDKLQELNEMNKIPVKIKPYKDNKGGGMQW